ncbi:MAG: cytochrome P450 [Microthrixaceae bacterium]
MTAESVERRGDDAMGTIELVSGADADTGHLEDLRRDPIGLMQRVRDECGDVGRFRLGDRDVVLVTGPEANEWFFRATEEELNQAEAYPFMTPIFGEGVVFDAPPERRREMLHNQALRDSFMRGHATTITREVDAMVADWDPAGGEIDLLDWFAELTIYTSSACLIGPRFRAELDGRFARLYHDLEQGTDAMAYVDPYADIESFRRRDAARVALVELVSDIMDRRDAGGEDAHPDDVEADKDLLDVLMSIKEPDGSPKFSADVVTGMFISMMFAGHHTTSGTAAWTLIELLRHPDEMAAVTAEIDALMADGGEVSYQALREIPRLDAAIKEALRLHPPLIILMRVAQQDMEVRGHCIEAGQMVAASVTVSNRLPEAFDRPDEFDPGRYLGSRADDLDNPWSWIPFGAGRHRCVGAAFAQMQLKAIFITLLHRWSFEAAQPLETYRNDHSKMVVQLAQPCVARYRSRAHVDDGVAAAPTPATDGVAAPTDRSAIWGVVVDQVLCQGHAVCQSEAPQVFSVDTTANQVHIADRHPPDALRPQVEAAVRYCPTHALTITEEQP